MTVSTLNAQLDAHDALVRAVLDGTLSLLEFAAAYGDFPAAIRATSGVDTIPVLAAQHRIAFHGQIAGILAGVPDLEGWLAGAVTVRLRHLAARYPDFTCGG